ncbi:MAG TPA: arginyltransferase [Desulfobulbaceae bacterium]|nr:arginyltransferase [Desulfobulbaceae bacterium]
MAIAQEFEQCFVDITTSCPYGLKRKSVYHQAVFSSLDSQTMAEFLGQGYRRNGNCMYSMRCPGCNGCVPIRIRPQEFRPDRNQKRVWRKNSGITVGVAPLTMTKENLALLDRFLHKRFPEGKSTADSYYTGFFITSIAHCFEFRYRIGDKLLGVAIVDGSEKFLNAVYFSFDPDEGRRSPGTLNILYLIDFCRNHHIEFLYLGYWIKEVKAMRYKSAFKPHELYIDGRWQRIE